MVGAGSSRRVGYPLWPELIQELRDELAPEVELNHGSVLEQASAVRAASWQIHGNDNAYHTYLERRFSPARPSHDGFHQALIRLGCRGVVTANYDPVLESAAVAELAPSEPGFMCRPIQLHSGRIYGVLEFLRGIASDRNLTQVLHMHGYFDSPEHIILTEEDYRASYGLQEASHDALDTHHRKVVWSLLVNHPVFFVGFSMDDPVLLHLLSIVQSDFSSGHYLDHFALLPLNPTDDEQLVARRMAANGVSALFYPVGPDGRGQEDHSALPAFINELLVELGRDESATPGLLAMSDRWLEST
jgi:hypothetical protein